MISIFTYLNKFNLVYLKEENENYFKKTFSLKQTKNHEKENAFLSHHSDSGKGNNNVEINLDQSLAHQPQYQQQYQAFQ
jgi:hypothetical protein